MSSSLTSCLQEAKAYLRNYALATKHISSQNATIRDLLVTSLPRDVSKNLVASSTQPVSGVVKYIQNLLLLIHQRSIGEAQFEAQEKGSVDSNTINFLLQILLSLVIRPFLVDGFGSQIPCDPSLKDLVASPVCDEAELLEILSQLVPMVSEQTLISIALNKIPNMALLIAGLLHYAHFAAQPPQQHSPLTRLTKQLSPSKKLQIWQILSKKGCPFWARRIIQSQQTEILLSAGGLRHVSAYVLQPDSNGQVPLERMDLLANLIAAVPADLRTHDYLVLLTPQLFEAFSDHTADGGLRRRATAQVLRKLFEIHPETSVIKDALWKCMRTQGYPILTTEWDVSLKCLSILSSFSDLRLFIFSGNLTLMTTTAYYCHVHSEKDKMDAIERLIYRYLEEPGTDRDLVETLRSFSMEGNIPQEVAPGHKNLITPRIEYFCKILDQNKHDGSTIMTFLINLYHDHLRLQRSQEAFAHIDHLPTQLDLLIRLPAQYARLIFSPSRLVSWLQEISSSLSDTSELCGFTVESDHLVVLLNWLNNLLSVKPVFESEQLSACEQISSGLEKIVLNHADSDLRATAQALKQGFDLIILQTRTEKVSLLTSPNAAGLSSTTVDMEAGRKRYAAALQDLGDEMVPNRAHGLYLIGELAGTEAYKGIINISVLSPIILGLLAEEEQFVYHNAIKAMKKVLRTFGEEYRRMLENAMGSDRYTSSTRERIRKVLLDDDGT